MKSAENETNPTVEKARKHGGREEGKKSVKHKQQNPSSTDRKILKSSLSHVSPCFQNVQRGFRVE